MFNQRDPQHGMFNQIDGEQGPTGHKQGSREVKRGHLGRRGWVC